MAREATNRALQVLEQARQWLAKNKVYALVYLACAVAVLSPLWAVSFVPLLDAPQHEASFSALAFLTDGSKGFDRYYRWYPSISTYATFYYLGAFLTRIFGANAAFKVLMSLYLVGTPAALARLLRVLRRSHWAAIPAFAGLYGWPFYAGFGAYLLGVPLALLTMAEWISVADLEGPIPRRRWGLLAALSTLLFLEHALAFGLALLVASLVIAVFRLPTHWRSVARSIPPMLPSLGLFVYWTVRSFLFSDDAETLGATAVAVNSHTKGGTHYAPLKQKLAEIPQWFAGGLRGTFPAELTERIEQLLAATALALTILAIVQWKRGKLQRLAVRDMVRPWVLAALLVGLYFAFPMEAFNIWAISPRMVLLGYLGLLLLLPRAGVPGWAHALLMVPWVLIPGWIAKTNLAAFRRVDDASKGLHQVLQHAKPGQRLYGLIYDSYAPGMQLADFLHSGAKYMSERGGLTGFTFINMPKSPLRLRTLGTSPVLGRRGEWLPGRFRYDVYGPFYDYFLVRGATNLEARIRAPRGSLRRVSRSGRWSLYENTSARRQVAYSLDDHVNVARASILTGSGQHPCQPWIQDRIQCREAPWTWVGPTEQTLGGVYMPCTWAHPPKAGETLQLRFVHVPPADSLYGISGVADSGQRRRGADVRLQVFIVEPGKSSSERSRVLDQRAGASRGYRPFDVHLSESQKKRLADGADLLVHISTTNDAMRHFCFRATLFKNDLPR